MLYLIMPVILLVAILTGIYLSLHLDKKISD